MRAYAAGIRTAWIGCQILISHPSWFFSMPSG
ncbi:MAG: hypothetical protein ACI9MU_001862, partial [Alphaproteobacteria bacterium]